MSKIEKCKDTNEFENFAGRLNPISLNYFCNSRELPFISQSKERNAARQYLIKTIHDFRNNDVT